MGLEEIGCEGVLIAISRENRMQIRIQWKESAACG
jgi:hypothetical protein